MSLYIGLMSGTSADAVDAALVSFERHGEQSLLATHSHPFPPLLQQRILQLSQSSGAVHPAQIADLDAAVAELFAAAVQALLRHSGHQADAIRAIGSHGQTLYHAPDASRPYTWQIGDPSRLAWLTQISVVADFRRKDIAAGGQGAPLVPAFHAAQLRSREEYRGVLNIGGIANISLLPADPAQPVRGFDTGPGNALLDAWIQRHRGDAHDHDGQWAVGGQVQEDLLSRLLADAYFSRPAPKSTGRDYFNLNWLDKHLDGGEAPRDVQATLVQLSVRGIAGALAAYPLQRLLVCGGGVHNPLLMDGLRAALPCPVASTQTLGLAPDWIEACCFAWLARRTLHGQTGNLPEVTGAERALVLGGIYPP